MLLPLAVAGALVLVLVAGKKQKKAPPAPPRRTLAELGRFAAPPAAPPSVICPEPVPVYASVFGWQSRIPSGRYELPPGSYPAAHRTPFPAGSRFECSPVSRVMKREAPAPGFTEQWIDEFGRAYGGRTPSLGETLKAGADLSGVPGLEEIAEMINAYGGVFGEIAKSPLWDIAITGAYLVPGGGPFVSAGMRMAIELGRGASLEDASLAAAREALPPGPARAAFDAGMAAMKGEDLSGAGLGAVRVAVAAELGSEGAAGFDAAAAAYERRN
jgi:hypothetical protein